MEPESAISTIKNNPIFANLKPKQVEQLLHIALRQTFQSQEAIIKEGEKNERVYLILSGSVAIERSIESDDVTVTTSIATLEQGDIFGEVSFLDHSPRLATVVTSEETVTLSWSPDEIEKQILQGNQLVQQLKNNLIHKISGRFRATNEKYLESLKQQLIAAKEQIEFGRLFLVVILLMGFNGIVVGLVATDKQINPYTLTYGWTFMGAIIVAFLIYIRLDFSRLSDFGVTLHNLKQSIVTGLVGSVCLVLAMFVILFSYSFLNPSYVIKDHLNYFVLSPTAMISYPFHVYLQEFIGRGVMLNSFCHFYREKPLYFSILVSSFLFGAFHVSYGILASIVTFLSGIIFSIIYLRDRNLIGVTIVHSVAGWAAIFVGLV